MVCVISLWSFFSSKLEEEASAIVITSDDTWVALIKNLTPKKEFAGSLQELVQMMLMKHIPPLISQITMLIKSGLLMHRLFSLPNISGSMIDILWALPGLSKFFCV